uniref:RNA-dependent RNA-polymerase n=1 Tax=Eastern red scorpionfish picornavirus TaxID=2486210 RepID=A0A3G4R7K0_9VIRU|nr:RNA-dependent RNA-polymerase [Eastern red scorpionfish picornavirus]
MLDNYVSYHNGRHGWGLCGNKVVTYSHGMPGGDMSVVYQGRTILIPAADLDYQIVEGTDCCTFVIPYRYGIQFKDIRPIIPRKPDLTLYKSSLLTPSNGVFVFQDATCLKRSDREEFVGLGSVKYEINYFANTRDGDCGALLMGYHRGQWHLLGLHNGAVPGVEASAIDLTRLVEPEGLVVSSEPAVTAFLPTRTSYTRSPYPDNELYQPAPLSSRDPRIEDPPPDLISRQFARKFTGNTYNIPSYIMDEAITQLVGDLNLKKSSTQTIDAALFGYSTSPNEMNTSAGFSYTQRGLKKRDLFDPETCTVTDMFRSEVQDVLDTTSRGENYPVTMSCNAKDELRPIAKIAPGGTRVIEPCDAHIVVAYRAIMGDICTQLYEASPIRTGFAPGTDPCAYSNQLYRELTKREHILACDFSGYDGSLPLELLHAASTVLASFHTNPQQVHAMHASLFDRDILCQGVSHHVVGGMSSGSPCTTIINTICNLLMLYCTALTQEKYLASTPSDPANNFFFVCYGDDFVCAHDGRQMDNQQLVAFFRETFGVKATSATKLSEELYCDIGDVDFLKRSFLHDPEGGYLLVLPRTLIEGHLAWTKSDFCQSQIDSALIEASGHGAAFYQHVQNKLVSALSKVPFSRTVMSFSSARHFFLSRSLSGPYLSPLCLFSLVDGL